MPYSLHPHAARQAEVKGFDVAAVLAAANSPEITYDNARFPGQRRHIRGALCAVVDPEVGLVITVYDNVVETAPRPDQVDRDARRYADKYRRRQH